MLANDQDANDTDFSGAALFDRSHTVCRGNRSLPNRREGDVARARSLAFRVDARPALVLEVRGPVLDVPYFILNLALVADGPDADEREELVLMDRLRRASVDVRDTVLALAESTRTGQQDLEDLPTLTLDGAKGRLLGITGADTDGDRELVVATQSSSGRATISSGEAP